MSREYESGCLHAPNPALHPRDDTTEAAFLGNPVRTSAVVRDEQIRRAVTEALAPLTRDLGLAVEALAARFPLPVRDHASLGYVVLYTEPDTGQARTWTEEVYPNRERAQEVIDDIFSAYTKRLLSVGEVRRAS